MAQCTATTKQGGRCRHDELQDGLCRQHLKAIKKANRSAGQKGNQNAKKAKPGIQEPSIYDLDAVLKEINRTIGMVDRAVENSSMENGTHNSYIRTRLSCLAELRATILAKRQLEQEGEGIDGLEITHRIIDDRT